MPFAYKAAFVSLQMANVVAIYKRSLFRTKGRRYKRQGWDEVL